MSLLIDEADLAGLAHLRSSALLRRWLAETHTELAEGPLRLTIGPLRLDTEVRYRSPTGGHGFGPLRIVDDADRPVAAADPGVLVAACSLAARTRAAPDAPINRSAGSLVEWFLRELPVAERVLEAPGPRSVRDESAALDWLRQRVETELLPAVRSFDGTDVEQVTATLLTGPIFGALGSFGRAGIADERRLLRDLAHRLAEIPDPGGLTEYWLGSPTLTGHALLNGSALRYGASGELESPPARYEVPNPLLESGPTVPGAPVPVLRDGWSLRPVELDRDVDLVWRWMNAEHVAVNWGQAWSWDRWRAELTKQLAGDHKLPCIVSRDGRDIAYLELYRVARDGLSRCYPYHAHDLGVHIAIGERSAIGRGLGARLLRATADGLLAADPACRRVVAEPDVHNAASIAAFRKAGYSQAREVGLPRKNSVLMVFTRRHGADASG